MKEMKCNDCGKILPGDSEFCQYCGSKNISEYVEQKPIYNYLMKKCAKCGRELPDDSDFCQYCGSKNIYIEDGVIENNNNKNNDITKNVLLIPLIIVSLLAAGLGYGMYHNYKDYNELLEETNYQITKLNGDVARAREDSSRNQKRASYYNEVLSNANYSNGYSDFYARQTLLRNPIRKTVWVYFGYYNTNVWAQGSSGSVNVEWGNSDSLWLPLTITYQGSGVEYVKLTNDRNNEVIYITLVGD